ncbi:hypothetical protein I309_05984 [Cryptococcus deuterogattii LA55]|nr:hypothetical protein I309_05984 [Cryptococcus deuterogattii LA55]
MALPTPLLSLVTTVRMDIIVMLPTYFATNPRPSELPVAATRNACRTIARIMENVESPQTTSSIPLLGNTFLSV